MALIDDILLQLTKQLYPSGRAFQIPADGILERLHKAINSVQGQAYENGVSLLNDILPDNSEFDSYDCAQWERRLGLVTNTSISLDDRKLAIFQKMAYPGIDSPPRQAASFLQTQLRAAGYDVYVYENRFMVGSPPTLETRTPSDILGVAAGTAILDTFELGEVELDEDWIDAGITLCVNYLEETKDAEFSIGSNYRSTFYIAGALVSTFASVPIERKESFRQLILTLKPAQTVGILFVNYI